jgi:DNA-directed RNA polymerase sigma subunit (sigma70/sigma32)
LSRERTVLRYRYGFAAGDIYRAHEFEEIARILGLTKPKVTKIHAEAIRKLQEAFLCDAQLRGDGEHIALLREAMNN